MSIGPSYVVLGGFSSLFRLLPKRRRRRDTPLPSPATVLLFHPPTMVLPHLEAATSPPSGTRLPSLLYPPHPLAAVVEAEMTPLPPLASEPAASNATSCYYHIVDFSSGSSTSNSVAIPPLPSPPVPPSRYYHSVLLAIYRPLSTTLPPNGVYRCCLPACLPSWLLLFRDRSRSRGDPHQVSPARGTRHRVPS